jgi:hypothetical protein
VEDNAMEGGQTQITIATVCELCLVPKRQGKLTKSKKEHELNSATQLNHHRFWCNRSQMREV